MKLLILYATTEGQTRKIARHLADWCADAGHVAELLPLDDADDIDLDRFDGVVLGASVHAGSFQKALTTFAANRHADLGRKPTLFLTVSLAAAGHDAEDWRALDKIQADLQEATGWTPGRVEHVAGAYMPSRYDILRRLIMRRIVAAKDPDADLDADHEYTDWPALDRSVEAWLSTFGG